MSLTEAAADDHKEVARQEPSEQDVRSGMPKERSGSSSPALRILREDLNHLKKDFLKAFKDIRTPQDDTSALTLLRDDLSQFKEDVSGVFRKKDGRDGAAGPLQEFRRDADRQHTRTGSHRLSGETVKGGHAAMRWRGLCTGTGQEHQKKQEQHEEEAAADILLCLTDVKDAVGKQPADDTSWSGPVACYLTLDPNTANNELRLSEGNRKLSRAWSSLQDGQHPQRFLSCPQVLCREGLAGAAYWEVLWGGGADVGVAYSDLPRDGNVAACLLGLNRRSWSLECSESAYTVTHDNRTVARRTPRPFTHRVGVHLDWAAGLLSFYCVSGDAMTLIHTFNTTFTEPLYPAFWLWAYNASVTLCSLTLGWETRLRMSCSP